MTECGNLPTRLCLWWLIRKCHSVLPYSRGKPVSILFQDAHETCRDPSFICRYRTFSPLPPSSTLMNTLSAGTAWALERSYLPLSLLFPVFSMFGADSSKITSHLKKKKHIKMWLYYLFPFPFSNSSHVSPHPALSWNHGLFSLVIIVTYLCIHIMPCYYCHISMYTYYALWLFLHIYVYILCLVTIVAYLCVHIMPSYHCYISMYTYYAQT